MAEIPDRGPQLRAVNIFFVTITLVAMSLRCYVRIGMVKAFGVDDYLMVLATVFFCLYTGFSTAGVTYGTGRHRSDLPVEDYETAMRCWWFCYLFYALTMIISKISIGCFLIRLITKRLQKWIVYGAMGVSALAGITFFVVTIFQCSPVSYFWFERQVGTCIPPDVIIGLAILYSVFSCISDLTFAILPGFLVWSLKMKLRTKLALVPLLAMGCIASCAVIARFPYLFQIRSPDFLWATLDVAIWSTVEQGLTITAASLATIRPLMKSIGYRLGLTNKSTTGPSGYYGATSGRYGNNSHVRKGSTLGALAINDGFKLSSSAVRSPLKSPHSPWNDKQPQPFAANMKGMKKKSSNANFGVVNTSEEQLHRPSTSHEV
ncbi:uncharacterized protein B0I36DRAFT_424370 [Microdochium trichocladiopsis]|uniref:Rhodopsin domain-containing protein n=1 Tax=Microdochium trichocladiopsis TaxID=1682393 RepID=A0A9P9BMY1_9PEZI|nr:uncharacterized protein B0I36DRAFT_424370 [Microdochium trichocladiopsis]KAH7026740.1 hypothetical protein B0I36DRAFT_424370 [Microdochium trichocladiopsis]